MSELERVSLHFFHYNPLEFIPVPFLYTTLPISATGLLWQTLDSKTNHTAENLALGKATVHSDTLAVHYPCDIQATHIHV